jgi:PAS domain S-box-containing protein
MPHLKQEDELLKAVALRNAQTIHAARERAEQALREANAALERRTAELRESEERFRSLFQQAAVGMAIASLEGRFEQVNRRICDIFGYSREELLQRGFRDITHPADLVRTDENVRRLLAGEVRDCSYEKRYLRKDGTTIWALVTITLLRDENGRPDRFIGIVEDVSEKRRAQEVRARLAAVVDSSDDAIISKTLDGIITSWNAGAERIFGYTAEETIGKPINLLIPEDRPNEEPAILERLKRGERVDHYETVRRRKDGSLLDISLTISPIRSADGKIIGASKIGRDITDRKRHEAAFQEEMRQLVSDRTSALQQTVGELESFSYSISHDLRAPLRAIQSFSLILAEECAAQIGPQGRDYIRRITSAAERMDRLIQDVLNYSRVARSDLLLTRVRPDKLLRDIVESHPNLQSPNAQIESKGPFPAVLANEAVLTQCISNLLGNAVKFVAPGVTPKVEVTCQIIDDGRVRVLFKDNGIGIDPAVQEKIFGIFERLSTRYEGTGIGLAIVKKGIERMGGSVGLKSKPGEGSTFWLELRSAGE